MVKKFYEFEDAMNTLEWAEELNLPYKLVRTIESRFNELTDETNNVTVYLFRFL